MRLRARAVPRAGLLVLLGCAMFGSAEVCRAQAACLEARVTASDAARFDSFGRAVAVSGGTVLIGAFWDDDDGIDVDSGSAYIFNFDGRVWVQVQKLVASDGVSNNWFGHAVTLEGDVAMVGAVQHIHSGHNGAVYVFRRDGTTWAQEQELLALDSVVGDGFGASVSISGDRVIIGSPSDDDIALGAGSAYVFRFDAEAGEWVQEQKLFAADGETADNFGLSVAMSGDVAVIGSPGQDLACPGDPTADDAGAAYVFRFDHDASQWVQEQELIAPDCAFDDNFGCAVSITDDLVVVGERRDDDNGFCAGAAYVFRYDPVSCLWVFEQKLLASDGHADDQFGISVAAQ